MLRAMGAGVKKAAGKGGKARCPDCVCKFAEHQMAMRAAGKGGKGRCPHCVTERTIILQ